MPELSPAHALITPDLSVFAHAHQHQPITALSPHNCKVAYVSSRPTHVSKQHGQAHLTSTQRFRHHPLQAPPTPQHRLHYSHTHATGVCSTCTHHARPLCLCTLHINPSQHCLYIVASFASAYTSFNPTHVLTQSGQANLTSAQRCFHHHHLQAPPIPQHCLQYSHTHVKPVSIRHPPPMQHISYSTHGTVHSIRARHISTLSLGHQRPYLPEP